MEKAPFGMRKAFENFRTYLQAKILEPDFDLTQKTPVGFSFGNFSVGSVALSRVDNRDNLIWLMHDYISKNPILAEQNPTIVGDVTDAYMEYVLSPEKRTLKVSPYEIQPLSHNPEGLAVDYGIGITQTYESQANGIFSNPGLISSFEEKNRTIKSNDVEAVLDDFFGQHAELFNSGEDKNDSAADKLNDLLKVAVLGITDEGEYAQPTKFAYSDFSLNQKDTKGRKVNLLRLLDEHLQDDSSAAADEIRATIDQFIDPETTKLKQVHNKKFIVEPTQNPIRLDFTYEEPTLVVKAELSEPPLLLTPAMKVDADNNKTQVEQDEDAYLRQEALLENAALRLRQPYDIPSKAIDILAKRSVELKFIDSEAESVRLADFLPHTDTQPREDITAVPAWIASIPRVKDSLIKSVEPPKDDPQTSPSSLSKILKVAAIATGVAIIPSTVSESEANISELMVTPTETSISDTQIQSVSEDSGILFDSEDVPIAVMSTIESMNGDYSDPPSNLPAIGFTDVPVLTKTAPVITLLSNPDIVIDQPVSPPSYQPDEPITFSADNGISFSEIVALDTTEIGGDFKERFNAYIYINPELADNPNTLASGAEIIMPTSLEGASKVKCDWERIVKNLNDACSFIPKITVAQNVSIQTAKLD